MALNETGIDAQRGSLLIRHGKGDKRREAGMDQFGFEQLAAWLTHRVALPPGPLFCVIDGPNRGRLWSATAARGELRQLAIDAGVRRRFAPYQLRRAHAVELAREGVAINIIQRQLGHTDLGTTSTHLQGIDPLWRAATRNRGPPRLPLCGAAGQMQQRPGGRPDRRRSGSVQSASVRPLRVRGSRRAVDQSDDERTALGPSGTAATVAIYAGGAGATLRSRRPSSAITELGRGVVAPRSGPGRPMVGPPETAPIPATAGDRAGRRPNRRQIMVPGLLP